MVTRKCKQWWGLLGKGKRGRWVGFGGDPWIRIASISTRPVKMVGLESWKIVRA